LEAVVPTFHDGLQHKLQELFPLMDRALRSRFAIVRQAAARCFATLCDVMTLEAMRYVVENIILFLQDPLVATNRQGTMELIYRQYILCSLCFFESENWLISDIVNRLDIKALPYIIFMVVPVLGRMSDSNDDIRATASNTFASLVKMIPLEVSTTSSSFHFVSRTVSGWFA
jgi:TATA-binding protein-associated factor